MSLRERLRLPSKQPDPVPVETAGREMQHVAHIDLMRAVDKELQEAQARVTEARKKIAAAEAKYQSYAKPKRSK